MNNPLKIIFAGTPEFAAHVLQALLETPHDIIAVYTQPDRPAGRGRQLTASPVKQLALKNDLPVYQPATLKDLPEQKVLRDLNADMMIVVAYGLLLPKAILSAPRYGCLNVHASLLPRWRGAAPIQRAILAGDAMTGVTIMQMDEGLDTGPMLYKLACPILATDNSQSLHDRLAALGTQALLATLNQWPALQAEPQDHTAATYAKKITKEEAKINWHTAARELENKIRAFNPWPVAHTLLDEQTLRIWQAESMANDKHHPTPGLIVHISPQGIDVTAAQGILRLQILQMPGGRALRVADILNARRDIFQIGKILT